MAWAGCPWKRAAKPNSKPPPRPIFDRLAAEGSVGLSTPIRPGVEPGSGPAHLSLFSYDPIQYPIGRGVLEALGINFPLTRNDVAARGNFATADAAGVITDRRAGRIGTDECIRLCAKLQAATGNLFPGYELFVEPVKEHRFVLVLRGEGLGGVLTETDPLAEGKMPLPVEDLSGTTAGQITALMFNKWVMAARFALSDEPRANSLNLRGIASDPGVPRFPEIYGMRAGCHRRLPHVQGPRPPRRHGRHRLTATSPPTRLPPSSRTGRTTTSSSSTSSTPTVPAKTATSTPRCKSSRPSTR